VTTKARGRPNCTYVADAKNLIARTDRPLSTLEIAEACGLSRSQTMTLRRALRRDAVAGRLLKVGQDERDSYVWAAPPAGKCGNRDIACWSAAYALRRALPDAGVDVRRCFDALQSVLESSWETKEQGT
jgi:hypothetical protein